MTKNLPAELDLSIVIPCFNEGASLPTLLRECREFLITDPITFIIVNNGSTDDTLEILSREKLPKNLIAINLPHNLGYGGGILKGLERANTNYVGWTHADLQTQILDIRGAISIIKSQTNIGKSLFIKGFRVNRRFLPRMFSIGMGLVSSMILRERLRDVNAQPTIISKNLISKHEFRITNFNFDLEAYFYAKRNHGTEFRFKVQFLERKWGNSTWNSGIMSRLKFSKSTIQSCLLLRKNLDESV
jgi:glycosyltransferase involved in cell wall biosynthesis